MKRFSSVAGLALAVVIILGLAGPATAGEQVPFRGSYEGDVSRGELVFPFIPVLVEGAGVATQLGQFTVSHPHVVNVATGTGAGTYEFTAANGDTLTADSTGQATPVGGGVLLIEETVTVTGGTGRFAGATGSITGVRLYDTLNQTTVAYFEGAIAAPGLGGR